VSRLRWLLLFILAVGAAASMTVPPAGAQDRIDGATYLARLQQADSLAQQGFTTPTPALMDEVRATLDLPVQIILGGRTVLAPAEPLIQQLRGDLAAEFHQAHGRLTALITEARLALGSPPSTEAELRSALEDAYDGIRFERPSLLQRILSAISDTITRAVNGLFEFSGLRTILEWLAVLALLAIAARVLLRGRLVPERRVRGAREQATPSARAWIERSDRALSTGDVGEAVRALYRALVAALAARGLTTDSPSLTAGECRAAVAQLRPGLYPLVAEATGTYERVAYGLAPADPEAVEALREAAVRAGSA
jgi:hypothetical protein